MFGFRGRGGPSRATPANARHYSYECKASSQDRPYVSRPSRTQQMRNPKLVPKLDSDTPKPLENKSHGPVRVKASEIYLCGLCLEYRHAFGLLTDKEPIPLTTASQGASCSESRTRE
ncbi:hypothetical protein GMORB2_0030 [Geosmithia morbida]|uniref:Uncharacterized protein n=1 Tax=Geosmithia morbida TaxID=1094350 RepID=A0A9P4Z2M3_9HYPO|nr:uncharacterized protein GMORB2_0030 [Geosmithia morbida]KAF4126294.1 hypothetical protein GMORB2_0030 [Geosmithia morbida]